MTTSAAIADLTMRFNAWLSRFSPPRQIASNPLALQDDANALLRIVLNHAPSDDWQGWYDGAMRHLEASMTTRSWPAPGEVVRACRAAERPTDKGAENSRGEHNAIAMLIDWYGKFKTQMPGLGRSDRTQILVQRGILKDEREARFRGFNLSPEALANARDQEPTRAEWDHHVAVMARLKQRSIDEVDFELQDDRRKAGPFRHVADVTGAQHAAE